MRLWLLVALGVASTAAAQESKTSEPASTGSSASKQTVINFEDETIQGDLTRPDGEYIEAAGKVQHSNLIKIREEFNEKVMQSVDEL
ncbi:MAG TPA: adventurous gliding motility protein CglF [Myxococcaceae bacterium]|jgi:hypothetical protein|nr:adventurous gliding motility protein CglF [Myxococcaceae bacterium]